MSMFGYDTFKQTVLDEIQSAQRYHNMTQAEAVAETCEVIAFLSNRTVFEKEERQKLREEIKREVLAELKAKLG